MNSHLLSIIARGERKNMARFELDRLFGLALTDARFFQHLQEHPQDAVAQFELSESEAQAVIDIAPSASSIKDLAIQLELWQTGNLECNTTPDREQGIGIDMAMKRTMLSSHTVLEILSNSKTQLRGQDASRATVHNNEQGICVTLNKYIPHN